MDTLVYLGHYLLQEQLKGTSELDFSFDRDGNLLQEGIKDKEIFEVVSKSPVTKEEVKSLVKSLQMGVVDKQIVGRDNDNKIKVYL